MGAQIILCDPHRATVIGHDHKIRLRATTMTSPDIRAGVALLIAAMSADGRSVIQNVEQIDRGYQNIDGRLNAHRRLLSAASDNTARRAGSERPVALRFQGAFCRPRRLIFLSGRSFRRRRTLFSVFQNLSFVSFPAG